MVVATTLSEQAVNANITRVMQILAARDQLSQGEVGLRLGHGKSTMSHTVAGRRKWTTKDLRSLAQIFDVPVDLFFEEPESLVRRVLVTDQEPAELVAA